MRPPAVRLTADMGWAAAFVTSYLLHVDMFTVFALFNWFLIAVFKVKATEVTAF